MASTFTIYLVLLHHTATLPYRERSQAVQGSKSAIPFRFPSHNITGSIHPSAWKVNSEKSRHFRGTGFIHAPGSLFSTTTYRPLTLGLSGLRCPPHGSQRAFYALSCIRTSENFPSRTFVNSPHK